MSLLEINEAAQIVQEEADPDANIIFGAVIDESLNDEIRITVIATGFDCEKAKMESGVSFDTIKSQGSKSEVAATQSNDTATASKDESEDFTVPTWLRKSMR